MTIKSFLSVAWVLTFFAAGGVWVYTMFSDASLDKQAYALLLLVYVVHCMDAHLLDARIDEIIRRLK